MREAERKLGIANRLAGAIRDRRDQSRIDHELPELLKTRVFAIACGYEDANDLDRLRHDPLLKLAVGRCPETGDALCSQSTMSRLENMPSKIEAARLTAAFTDQFCASFPAAPKAMTLDIDDTVDEVHGGQQLSFWNAHYDCRCFQPMHIYHVESGKPVSMILRGGKTPKGKEVRTVIKHLTRRIRRHIANVYRERQALTQGPQTRITWRGDSHYGRTEAMNGTRTTPSATFSAWLATPCTMVCAGRSPTIYACVAQKRAPKKCALSLGYAIGPRAGTSRARWWPGLRQQRWDSISATSSPRCPARRNIFMRRSIANAARPRT